MTADKQFLDAIAEIEAAMPDANAKALMPISGDEICKIIKKIKTPLEFVIPIIENIPIYGKAVATALRLLLKLADSLCPA